MGSIVAAYGEIGASGPVSAASVSATHSYSASSYPPAKLIDGDTTGSGGFWAGSSANLATDPAVITLELGAEKSVSRVKLHRVASYLSDYVVKDAEVQVRKPDNAWQTVGTLSNNSSEDHPEIVLTGATGSALRVLVKGVRSGNLVLMAEVTMSADGGATSVATARYDAWGKVTQATGAIPAYGYAGREPDATGLIHYRARYYHPGLGRFASRDPMGLAAGINPYAYAGGNPILYNDPDGLLAQLAWNTGSQYWGEATDWAGRNGTAILDGTQTVLDVAGLVPGVGEIADGANALIYLGRGDYTNAGLSAAAMVPFAGWGATTGKLINKADGVIDAANGLGNQNSLYKTAVQQFKVTDLSNAGRALTKHPEVIGQTKDTLRQSLRSDGAINDAAHAALRDIMRNGVTTTPTLGRYGTVTQTQIPGGFGARWASDGSFIGFINP